MSHKKNDDEKPVADVKKGFFCSICDRITGVIYCTLKFLPSPAGLILILAIFTLLGAGVFYSIESKHEKHMLRVSRMTQNKLRTFFANEFLNISQRFAENQEAFIQRSMLLLQEYDRLREQTGADVPVLWQSYIDAIFYSAAVYTTIGYGNAYPRTKEGKVFTIFYALVGIPLCLVVLAELGRLLTRGLKMLFRRIKSDLDDVSFPINDEFDFSLAAAVVITLVYLSIGAIVYHILEPQWTLLDAFYFIFISGSTIGFGDMVPTASRWFFIGGFLYIFGAVVLVSTIVGITQGKLDEAIYTSRDYLENLTLKRENPAVAKKQRSKLTEEEIAEIYGRKGDKSAPAHQPLPQIKPEVIPGVSAFALHHGPANEYELEVARIYGRAPNSWQGKGVIKPAPLPAKPSPPPAKPSPPPPVSRPAPPPVAAPAQPAPVPPPVLVQTIAPPPVAPKPSSSPKLVNKQVMTSSMVDELIKGIITADSSLSPSPEDTEVTNFLLSVSSCSSLAASNPQIAQPFGGKMTFVDKKPSPIAAPVKPIPQQPPPINSDDQHQSSNIRPLVTVQVSGPQQPQTSPSTKQLRLSNLAQRCKSDVGTSSGTTMDSKASTSSGGTLHTPNSAFTPIGSRESSQTREQKSKSASFPNEEVPLNDSPNPTDPKAFASPRNVRVTYKAPDGHQASSSSQPSSSTSSSTAADHSTNSLGEKSVLGLAAGIMIPSYAALLADSKSPLAPRTSAFSSVQRDSPSTPTKSRRGSYNQMSTSVPAEPSYLSGLSNYGDPSYLSGYMSTKRTNGQNGNYNNNGYPSDNSPPSNHSNGGAGYYRGGSTARQLNSARIKEAVPTNLSPGEDRIPHFNSQLLNDAAEFGASIGRSRARRAMSTSPTPLYPQSMNMPPSPITTSYMSNPYTSTPITTYISTSSYSPSTSRLMTSRPSPATTSISSTLVGRHGSGSVPPPKPYKSPPSSSRHN